MPFYIVFTHTHRHRHRHLHTRTHIHTHTHTHTHINTHTMVFLLELQLAFLEVFSLQGMPFQRQSLIKNQIKIIIIIHWLLLPLEPLGHCVIIFSSDLLVSLRMKLPATQMLWPVCVARSRSPWSETQ